MAKNKNLHEAKKAKNDEFYTRMEDIDNELKHYRDLLRDKVIYCNCDDPLESNFCKHFMLKFNFYGLKKLICTCYNESALAINRGDQKAYKVEITKVSCNTGATQKEIIDNILCENVIVPLEGNGDFRSKECVNLLDECDIVITNPPFSLFREFVNLIVAHNKQFLVIGSQNAITYKEIFPLIKDNRIWLGNNAVKTFNKADGTTQTFGNICWFTNLPHRKRNERLELTKTYSPTEYPKYDNYDAIEVDKVKNIPRDYMEVMGVPITFLDKYNSKQFEIIGISGDLAISFRDEVGKLHSGRFYVSGKRLYDRIAIKRLPTDKQLQDELDAIE